MRKWTRAHQVNQRQEVYQYQIRRNGKEINGHCVHVGDTIWGTRSFERNVEEVGEGEMKQEG